MHSSSSSTSHCLIVSTMKRIIPLLLVSLNAVSAIDNGLGVTPPRGWRSWNQFQCGINQTLIEDMYERIAARTRTVGGKPTSLLDLGYKTAGIDDCWQKCNSGPGGKGFHNASGYPIVDDDLFPDMRAMTNKAKSLGIVPGWYGNNCHCSDQVCRDEKCFAGDVQATLDFGFESIKLDGCGIEKNVTLFSELFNKTGRPVLIENCHNGNPVYPVSQGGAGEVDCPMNFFRSSTDIRPTFGSVLINLRSTEAYNGKGLTGPGCWAYPDMLEVGVTNSQRPGCGPGCLLNYTEARTHFGAWCLVSAPLVLGLDLADDETMDTIWPIISNVEAIEVNEAWAGDAGVLLDQSSATTHMANCSWFNQDGCDHPSWMTWRKKLPGGKVAFLLMNNDVAAADVSVTFADVGLKCGAGGCQVRDIWAHADLPRQTTGFTAKQLGPRDSAFIVVTP